MNLKQLTIRATILIVLFFGLSATSILYSQQAGPDKTVTCSSSVMAADDPGAFVGTWTTTVGPAVVTFPNQFNSPVTGLQAGVNTFRWQVPGLGIDDYVTIIRTPANAGPDQTVCGSALLNGSNPSPGTGLWSTGAAGVVFDDATSPTATVSNLPFGGATLTWEVTIEGCTTSDIVIITNDLPLNVDAGPDDVTCDGTFTFAATDPSLYGGTGLWTVIAGSGTFVDATLFNTAVSGLAEGVNTFRWTETNGACSDYDEITIINNGVTATASDQNICQDNTTLDGNLPAGATGLWTVVAGTGIFADDTSPTTDVTGLSPNINTFRWTLTKGICIDFVEITVFYDELMVNAGVDQNICGSTTTLNGSIPGPGETGQWTLQAGSGAFTNANLNNTGVTGINGLANNVYRWTISKPGCTSVFDDVIVINNALPVDAGPDQLNICTNTINLEALSGNPVPYGGTGLWTTASTAIITTPNNYQTTATDIGPGTSVFRWTVTKNGCASYDEMTVTRSLYFVSAGPDQTICDDFTTLQGSNPGPSGTGTWSVVAGGPATIDNYNDPNANISNIMSFPITLRWTVAGGFGGCSGDDEVVINKTTMTQAEIAGGDVEVPCNANFYNGLTAVNGPNLGAGETSRWYQVGGANIVFSAPINSSVTDLSNLTVPLQHTVVYEITDGICTSDDTITVTTYNFAAVVNAGPDIVGGCSEWITLGATPVSSPYIGTWTAADATSVNSIFEDPNNPNTRVETNNPSIAGFDGTYSYRWTVVNGTCSGSDVVNVTNNWTAFAAISAGAPDYTFGDKDIYLCSGATITLWGHPQTGNSNSGGWEIPNVSADFTFTGGAGNVNCVPNTGFNLRHKDWNAGLAISGMIGDWDIVWHQCSNGSNNNCKSQDTLHFHVLLDMSNGLAVFGEGGTEFYDAAGNPLPFAGPDQDVCGYNTTMAAVDPTVSAIPNLTGTWSGPAYVTFSDIHDPNAAVFGLQPGANTLTWTVSNGCSEVMDQVTVRVWGTNVTSAGEDQIICEDFTNLDAVPLPVGSTGEWSVFSGGGIIADVTSNTSYVSGLLPGENVFRWHVVSAFCNTDDYVTIYSNKPEHPNAGPDRYLCGSGAMLAQDPLNINDEAQWSVVSGGGVSISDIHDKNAIVTFVNPLSNFATLRWTIFKTAPNGLQCFDYDDADVYDYNPTLPDAGIDQTVCNTAVMTANPPGAGETGQWTFIQGSAVFSDPTFYQATVTGLDWTQTNILIWTLTGPDRPGPEGACSLQDTVEIVSNRVYVFAGPDKLDLCGNSWLLDANCPPLGTGSWSVTSGSGTFSGNTCNATVSNLFQGTNILRWTITYNGCPSYDEVTVVNNLPTTPDAGLDKTVCGTTTMAGNIPVIGTGTWTVISGAGTFVDPTLHNTVVNGLNYGSNLLVWTIDNNGCALTDTVNIWSDVVGANAGIDEVVCSSTHTLNGNNPAPGTGLWTPAGTTATILDPTNRNTVVTGMNPDANIFRWTITNGSCSTFDDVIITNDQPTTANAGPNQVVCENFTNLAANFAIEGIGTWGPAPGATIIDDSTNPTTLVTNLPTTGVTMFTWTITKNTCVSSDDVQIQYISTFNSAGPDQHICTDATTMAAVDPSPGTGQWSLLVGSPLTTFADPTLYNTAVSGLQPGQTILLWTLTNAASCISTDTVSIFNDGPYFVDAGVNQTVCGSSTNLGAVELTIGTGVWSTADIGVTIDDPTLYNTLVSGMDFGITTFTWTATYGACVVQDDVVIQNDSVDVSNAGIDEYICADSIQLNANIPSFGEGVWDLVQGLGTIADPTLFNTWVYGLGPGRNVFRWTVTSGTSGCVSYDFVNVYNLEINAYAGLDDVTCDGNYVLQGNNPAGQFIPPGYNAWGWWQQIPPAAPGVIVNPTLFNTQVVDLDYDVNTFVWTVTNGFCSATDEVRITNNEPTVAYAGPDTIVCHDYLTNLNANDPLRGDGFWRLIAGGSTITDPTLYNTGVTNLDYYCTPWTPDWYLNVNAVNIFEWVITYNGCESTDQVTVVNGLPETIDAGDDQTVCANVVNMDAFDEAGCADWHWWEQLPDVGDFYDPETGALIPDFPFSTNMPFNTHVEPIQDGMTQFVWHKRNLFNVGEPDEFYCELTDTVEVTKIGDFEDVQAGTNDAVCENYYVLDATDPDTIFTPPPVYDTDGEWTTIFGLGTFDDATNHNTTVRNIGAYTNVYRWTVTNHTLGCTMSDDVYIHSARPSAAVAGPDNEICTDFAILSANVPARYTQAYWDVAIGSASIINNSCTSFACDALADNIAAGTNVFVWHVINEYYGPYAGYSAANPLTCELTDTVVIINSSIVADAGNTIYICADTAQLNAVVPIGGTGEWLTGGTVSFESTGGITSTMYNDVALNLTRGKNTFLWTATKGICSNTDRLVVWNNLPSPNPNAGFDQVICTDSTTLASNTITRNDTWYNTAGTVVTQEGYSTQGWTVGLGAGTFDNPTQTNTWVYNVGQGDNEYIWNAYYHFTDYQYDTGVPGVYGTYNQTCTLTDIVNVYNNSVFAEAGSDGFVCGVQGPGATYTLGATQVTPPMTGWWAGAPAPGATIVNPSLYNTLVTGMQNGDHVYHWTVSSTYNGRTCTNTDQVTVLVRIPTTSVVALPNDYEICEPFTNLQANVPVWGNGTWSEVPFLNPGTVITDNTSNVTTVNGIGLDTRQFVWAINYDGCISRDTITVHNNMILADADDRIDQDASLHVVALNDTAVCQDWIILSANDPNAWNSGSAPFPSGVWTAFPGTVTFDNNTLYNTTARNLNDLGANLSRLTWTVTKGGCAEVSILDVVNNVFAIDASTSTLNDSLETCNGSIILDGEQPGVGTGLWTITNGWGTIVNPTLYNTLVTNINPGSNNIFQWNVTRSGCTFSNDVVISNNAVSSNAGVDQSTCNDYFTLSGGVPQPGQSGQWLSVIPGIAVVTTPTLSNSGVTGLVQGTNTFRWVISRGNCSAFDEMIVTNNSPDDFIIEPDKEVCTNNSTLSVNPAPVIGTGIWSKGAAGGSTTIIDPTSINTVVTGLQPGLSSFLWTVSNGTCDKVDTLYITNNTVVAMAGLNDTICTNYTNLAAIDPGTYVPGKGTGVWTLGGGSGTIANNTLLNTLVTGLAIGSNIFRWTLTEGSCTDTDDVVIVNQSVFSNASDIQTCTMPVILTGNDPVTSDGEWINLGGLGTIANSTLYNSSYSGLANTMTNTLVWRVYNEKCSDGDTIQITNNNFMVSVSPMPPLCSDNTILNGSDPLSGSGTWTVTSGSGTFADLNSNTTTVTNIGQGSNIYTWTVSRNGCTNSANVTITNNSPDVAMITYPFIGSDATCDGTYNLEANNPVYGTGQWSLLSGAGSISDATNFQTTVSGLASGPNVFVWTITSGSCTSTASVTITNNAVTADAGAAQALCTNFTNLNAAVPAMGDGFWTNVGIPGPVIADATLNTSLVSNLNDGLNTFRWTVTEGACSDFSDVQITNNSVTATANTISTCNSFVQLNGNDPNLFTIPGTGLWTNAGGTGTIVTPTLYNSQLTGLVTGATSSWTWTVTNGICNDAITIQVHNNNFSLSAGADVAQCSDTYTLVGDSVSGGNGIWTVIAGSGTISNLTIHNPIVTNLGNGVNTFLWTVTNANGCTNSDQINVTNNNPTISQITIPVTAIGETCDGTYTIQANNPVYGTGIWTRTSGSGTIADATNYQTSVTGLGIGPNIFEWTITQGGCTSTASVTINNNQVFANAGGPQDLCTDFTDLNAVDPVYGTGVWTNVGIPGPIIANSLSNITTVSNLNDGLNTFRWTVTQGICSAFSDVQITSNAVTAAATNISTCNSSVVLTGNDPSLFTIPGTGVWTVFSGTGTITTPTQFNSNLTGLVTGATSSYVWTVTNGICSDDILITVENNSFSLSAGADIAQCADSYTLAGDPVPVGGNGSWTVIAGSGTITNPTIHNTTITGIGNGVNTFLWTVTNAEGCTNSDQINITNNNPTLSQITIPVTALGETCDGTYTIQANSPVYGTGIWTRTSGSGTIADATNYQTLVTGLGTGPNIFTWTITQGACSSSADVTIINNNVTADAGAPQSLCSNTTNLNAGSPIIGTGVWTNVGIPGPVIANPTLTTTVVSNLNDGLNTFRWTVSEGICSDFEDVQIINNSVTATATNISTCNTNVTLTGNDPSLFTIPGTGLWTVFGGTGTITTPTLFNSPLTGLVSGATSSYIWTVTNGICNDDILIQVFNNNFSLSAGADIAQCADSYTLAGDPVPVGGNGVWTVIAGSGTIVNPTIHNTLLTGLGNGINTFVWTVTNAGGCTNSDQINITNNNPTLSQITIPVTGNGETCDGTYTIQANNPVYGTGLWTRTSGAGSIVDATNYQTLITGLGSGPNVFMWTITNGGCTSSASVTIDNNQVLSNAGVPQDICDNFTNLNAAIPALGSGYWTNVGVPGPVISTPTLNTTLVSNLSPGLNTFRWTVTEGICSAFDDVQINNNAVTASAANITTCNSTVQLNGNDPTLLAIPGTGVWTLFGGTGTIVTPTLYNTNVTGLVTGATSSYQWTVSNGICVDDIIIQVENQNFNLSAGADIAQCGNTYTLVGDVVPAGGTGIWTVIAGSGTFANSSLHNSFVSDLDYGINTFRWTVTNAEGCTRSDQVNITNNNPSTAQITIPGTGVGETCNGTYAIQGNNPVYGTGLWTRIAGSGTITDDTNFQTTVTGLGSGPNIFVWTISNGGCTSDASVTITNNQVLADAGAVQNLCSNATNLNAAAPLIGSGVWTNVGLPGPIVSDPTLNNSLVTNLSGGLNTFRWTVTQGTCTGFDDVQINNNSVTATGSNITTCFSTVQLNGNDPSLFTIPGTGLWTLEGGSGAIVTPTIFNTNVNGIPLGGTSTFRWTVTNGLCVDDVMIQVTNNNFNLSAGADIAQCGNTYTLVGDEVPAGGTGNWTVISGSGTFADVTAHNSFVSGIGYGINTYQWTVTNAEGCTNSDQLNITCNQPSTAQVTIPGTGSGETCDGTYAIQGNNPVYGSGQWSLFSGSGSITDPTNYQTTLTGLGSGPNVFVWTITNVGCTSSASVTITNSQVLADAGAPQNTCTSSTNLNANVPLLGSGVWTNVGLPGPVIADQTLHNSLVTNLSPGLNTFRWTVTQGLCSGFDDVQINNNAVEATASNITSCFPTVQLNGNDPSLFAIPGTGLWTLFGGTGTIVTPTLYNTDVTGLIVGATSSYRWTVTNGLCSDNETIQVVNNGFNLSAGADVAECNTSVTLNGDSIPGASGNWTVISGGGIIADASAYNTTVNGLGYGNNVFQWFVTNSFGCTNSDQVTITNNNPSTAQITLPIAGVGETCDGTYAIQGNNPIYGTGQWSLFTGAGTIGDATNFQTTLTGLGQGPNVFNWTISNVGCTSTAQVTITNYQVFADAGGPQNICQNYTNLNAAIPTIGSGTWTNIGIPGPIIANTALNNTSVTNLANGLNSFRWTVTQGICTDFSDVQIINNSVTASASSITTCNTSVVLNGNDPSLFTIPGTGLWTVVGGAGTLVNQTLYNTNLTGLVTGATASFMWTVTNGLCSDSETIQVENNGFNLSAGADIEQCSDSITLYGQQIPNASGTWSMFAGGGTIANVTSNITSVSGLANGPNIFVWTVTNLDGCTNNDQVTITNNNPTPALITFPVAGTAETCTGSYNIQGNNPTYGTGQWSLFAGSGTIGDATNYQTTVNGLGAGTNTFSWTISNSGCVSSANVTILNNQVISEAGPPKTLCLNSTSLNAIPPTSMYPYQGTGSWSTSTAGIVITNSLLETTTVSNIPNGAHTFTWTVTEGSCVSTDNVIISNYSVNATATNSETCDGNVFLTGNAPAPGENGVWTSFTPGVTYDDQTLYNTGAHNLTAGFNNFVWSVSNAYCNDDAVMVVEYINPIAVAGPNQTLCSDATYLAALNPTPGTGVWTILAGNGTFANATAYNSYVTNIQTGMNTYRWTVTDRTCTKTSDVTIFNNLPVASAGTDITTCDNFSVLPATAPGAGETGQWVVIGGTGVVTTPTLNNSPVTNLSAGVNVFQWTVNNGMCSNSDEVQIYNNRVTSISAGIDRAICVNTTGLAALPPGSGETGMWDALAGLATFSNPTAYNSSVSNLSQGPNTLRWTLTKGACTAQDLVVITNNSPTTPVVSPDDVICSNIYTLLGNPVGVGESGIWTNEFGATGTIIDPTANITTVTNIGQGSNTFRWTITNALCSAFDEIVITNSSINTDAGLDASLCTDTAMLAADNPAPGTGLWTIINSAGSPVFDNPSMYNTVIRDLGTGSNILLWTASNGICSAWDMVTISNDGPTPANAGTDRTVCDGTVILTGNNPTVGTGVWTRLGGSGTISNPTAYNTLVTGLGSGGNTFRWTVTQGACTSYDDVLVLNELVYASAGLNDSICGNYYAELDGNLPGTGETGIWTVTGGTGVFGNPTVYNTSVSGLSGGENRLTWTVTRGTCSNSADVSIYDNTPSTASVSADKEICTNFTVISGNPPATGTGHWEVAAGSGIFDDSMANTTTVRDIGDDLNIFRWIISNGGCTSSADIRVTNNSVYSIVGDSIFVCDTTAYLNGNKPALGETGIWTVTSGTGILVDDTRYNTPVNHLNKGINKFRWTISNGTCSDYADLVVINDLYDANASVAGPDSICTNYADLLGNIPVSGATGMWSVWAGGGSFDDPTSPTARISGLLKGENTLRWTVTKNGCSNWDDVVITNNMVEALAGSDVITCGNNANLVANELFTGESGLWTRISGAGTILTPSDNETVVTGLGAGVNVFRWAVTNGLCSAQDEVQVSENSFVTTAGFDQHVCNTSVLLYGQNPAPGTGIWSFSGPGVTIVNPTFYNTVVNGLQDNSPHTFRWTVSKNGCTAWDEVVIYNDLVHANAGADFATCTSNTTLAAVNPVAGSGIWTITAGAGTLTNETYFASGITDLGLGSNTLVWTVTNLTCVDSDIVIVTNNKVTATAGADIGTCNNSVYLNGDQPIVGGYGVWVTVGGPGIIQTPSAFNTQVTNLQRGNNTFQWTVYQNGCNNGGDLVTVTNNSFDAYAGEDQTLPAMSNSTNFEAILDPGQTGYWSILAGSGNIDDNNSPTSFVDNMPNGVNTFGWNVTNSFGCQSSADVDIIVANFTPNAGPDQIVCSDTAKLNATFVVGANSQSWQVISGQGTFDDLYDPKTIVRNILWGSNIYRWRVNFTGYSAYDDVVITNDSIFVSAGDDGSTCGTEWIMNAQYVDGATHLWTPIGLGGGIINNNSAWNTLIYDLPIGQNVFNWFVDNGNCQSNDIVIIERKAKPIAEFTTTPSDFCAPADVLIDNTSNFTPGFTEPDEFRWYIDDGDYLGTTYDVDVDLLHTFTNTGSDDSTYVIIMVAIDTETGCLDTVTHSVIARATPFVNFDFAPRITRYPQSNAEFVNLSDTGLSYLWNFGDGNLLQQDSWIGSTEHAYDHWGTYYITLTGSSGAGCAGVWRDSIIILPPCPYSYEEPALIAEGCQPLLVEFSDGIYFADSVVWRFEKYGNDSTVNNPVYTYNEPGEYITKVRAWSEGCDQIYTREDTVIVHPKPIVDFDVTPREIMVPNQYIHLYNYSEYGIRYLWNFGDDTNDIGELTEFEPIHKYTEPGIYDITLEVWTEHDCYDLMTIENAVFAEDSGFVMFPNAFKPNPNGSTGGYYPCLGDRIDTQSLNEIFYPLFYAVAEYHLEIYNRWGEKIYTSDELCKGWDGYVDGVMAPQDVYVWKVSVIFNNGEPHKQYGSVTLLR